MPPSRLLAATSVVAALAVFPIARADESATQYGTYICLTDRTAGLQTAGEGKERFAGAIKAPLEQERFFVTIFKVNEYEGHFEAGHRILHDPSRCFSQSEMQTLQRQWGKGGDPTGSSASGDIAITEFTEWCLATDGVEFKVGGSTYQYYSIGRYMFTDELHDRFWFGGDTFRWDYTNFAGDFYIAEGRCTLVR
jgi:hypothetical protein